MVTRIHSCRLLSAVAAILALTLSVHAIAGTVVSREFRSAALNRNWSYAEYVPSGYESSNLSYPVLYLLHGNGGIRYNWVNDGHIKQLSLIHI